MSINISFAQKEEMDVPRRDRGRVDSPFILDAAKNIAKDPTPRIKIFCTPVNPSTLST